MLRYRRYAALCAAYLGTFLASLDISIVNVALPTLQTALRTDIAGLQWVVNSYAICLSAFMLSAGPVGDRHGHKRGWLIGVGIFTVGSALCAMTNSLPILLFGRAVQGIAGALLIPGALPILTHAFPDPRERAHVIGGWSAFSALALILGPLLGGLLLHSFGWPSIFLINVPLGVVAVGLGWWGIAERKQSNHASLDLIGQTLSVLCLGGLTYGLIEAGQHGFISTIPLTVLALASVCFVLFAVVEKQAKNPLLPLPLFRQYAFTIANFASFVLGFSYYSSLFFFSIFLQQIQGLSPIETGWRMMPVFFVTGCVSVVFGRLCTTFSVRSLMIAGYGLIALSMSSMVFFTAYSPYWLVGTAFCVLGLGAGLALPATSMNIMNLAPAECSGMASTTMNALRQTGMTLGIAFLGTLMSSQAARVLAFNMSARGIADAATIARHAVTDHIFPNDQSAFTAHYTAAMEYGFHVAMLCAGIACAIAMILLMTTQSDTGPGSSKPTIIHQ